MANRLYHDPRINGKRLEPDKATPINDGDKLSFGKVTCTFKKA